MAKKKGGNGGGTAVAERPASDSKPDAVAGTETTNGQPEPEAPPPKELHETFKQNPAYVAPHGATAVKLSDLKLGGGKADPNVRTDYGDVKGLAQLIHDAGGIVSPLVIDDDGNVLSGKRRAKAAELLRLPTVPAVRVSGLAGWDQQIAVAMGNAGGKGMLPSEKVKMAGRLDGIEREKAKLRRSAGKKAEPGTEGGSVRDIVARAVEWSGATLVAAQTIFSKGIPELRAAVDAGKPSISNGAKIALLSKEEQEKWRDNNWQNPGGGRGPNGGQDDDDGDGEYTPGTAVVLTDANEDEVPQNLRDAFMLAKAGFEEARAEANAIGVSIRKMQEFLQAECQHPGGEFLMAEFELEDSGDNGEKLAYSAHLKQAIKSVKAFKDALAAARPKIVCPSCGGKGKAGKKDCEACDGCGYLPGGRCVKGADGRWTFNPDAIAGGDGDEEDETDGDDSAAE